MYSDSNLLVRTINEWLPGWKQKGWTRGGTKEIANHDLVREIDQVITESPNKIQIIHVYAHTGRFGTTGWLKGY